MRSSTSGVSAGITSSASKFSTTWLGRLAPVITVDTFGFVGAPRQRQLGQRAAELVGDRAQPLDLGRAPRASVSRLASQP